jgi:hypothetical protein
MKITIENDGPTLPTIQPMANTPNATGAGSSPGAAASVPPQTGAPTGGGSNPALSDLFAKAASIGAMNAGPAPTLSAAEMGPGPVVSSLGGASTEASMVTSSAGSPPPHVYGSKESPK